MDELEKVQPAEDPQRVTVPEIEGNRYYGWFFVCGECHGQINWKDYICPYCGWRINWNG